MAQTSAQSPTQQVGQLELAVFSNPSGLKPQSGGIYIPTEQSGEATFGKPGSQGFGSLAQQTVEGSNVSLVDEMVALMVTQRAYELSSKVAQTADELMSMTNNLRRS